MGPRAMCSALGALLVLAAPAARADDKTSAQALFDEGLTLFDAKEYVRAAADFASSQKLDPAAGTLLNLARCHEAMGNVATAWQTYGAAAAQARRDGDAKRERAALQKEAALAPTVPRLTIVLGGGPSASDVRVERDGVAVDSTSLAAPLPLDPGPHEITATAPGRRPWSANVNLYAGDTKRVDVPELERAVEAPVHAPAPETPATEPSGLDLQRTVAIITAGVGVVALGAGAYFGLHAKSLKSDADQHCVDTKCDADGVSLTDRAGSSADLATVFFIASGALVAGAVALWVTAPRASAAATSRRGPVLTAHPVLGPSTLGGAVQLSY